MSLLFGAEYDAEIERGRELQAGIKAEATIQLPPRDTKKSDKIQVQEEDDIRHGRDLREQHVDKLPEKDRRGARVVKQFTRSSPSSLQNNEFDMTRFKPDKRSQPARIAL